MRKRRLILAGFAILLIYLLYLFIVQGVALFKAQGEIRALEHRLQQLQVEKEILLQQARDLMSNETVEELARSQLGFVDPSERVFILEEETGR
ncbi:MAG: septum formation initiator family protein [Firmicutes bacterium]|nr:septum formation initiator family protein [Bacillota bacterium]